MIRHRFESGTIGEELVLSGWRQLPPRNATPRAKIDEPSLQRMRKPGAGSRLWWKAGAALGSVMVVVAALLACSLVVVAIGWLSGDLVHRLWEAELQAREGSYTESSSFHGNTARQSRFLAGKVLSLRTSIRK